MLYSHCQKRPSSPNSGVLYACSHARRNSRNMRARRQTPSGATPRRAPRPRTSEDGAELRGQRGFAVAPRQHVAQGPPLPRSGEMPGGQRAAAACRESSRELVCARRKTSGTRAEIRCTVWSNWNEGSRQGRRAVGTPYPSRAETPIEGRAWACCRRGALTKSTGVCRT